MCGRVTVIASKKELEEYYHAGFSGVFGPTYNGAPSQYFPILRNTDPREIKLARWGFLPKWMREKRPQGFINSKAETIFEKPAFKHAIKTQRCLIPASGFFEWQKETKTPYYIRAKGRKLFSFAGLWEEFENEKKKKLLTYSIITTSSASRLRGIHERMPVILDRKNEALWLGSENNKEIADLMKPYDDLEFYAISKLVNSPVNNDPKILRPLDNKITA